MTTFTSAEPWVKVGDAEECKLEWDTTQQLPVPAEGALVRIEHLLAGTVSWTQKAQAEVRPGDHLIYRAAWLPRPRRRLKPGR